MGLFNFFRKKVCPPSPKPISCSLDIYTPAQNAELTKHSKEEILVQRISLHDMEQFTSLPFVWNSEIKKVTGPSTQPYAFMDVVGSNVFAACLVLEEMNNLLIEAHRRTPLIPRITKIPIDDIDFTPEQRTGSTKIICRPYTFTGRLSKYPVSLFFKTPHRPNADSTHGELFFNQSGKVGKAEIICWRNNKGYFFHYKTVGQELVLDKIISTIITNKHGLPGTIYKSQHS